METLDTERAFRSFVERNAASKALKPGEPFSFRATGDSNYGLGERCSTQTSISVLSSSTSASTTADDRRYILQSFCDLIEDEEQVSLHSDLLRVLVIHIQAMYRMTSNWPSTEAHTEVHVKSTDGNVLEIFVRKEYNQEFKLRLIDVPTRQGFKDRGGLGRHKSHFALRRMADKLQETVFVRLSPGDRLRELEPLIRDSGEHSRAIRSGWGAEICSYRFCQVLKVVERSDGTIYHLRFFVAFPLDDNNDFAPLNERCVMLHAILKVF